MAPAQKKQWLASLSDAELVALYRNWRGFLARPNQLPPTDIDWDVWLVLAGRGFGKTRTGAEFVKECVDTGEAKRIALVARTAADVRDVMVEGESGLLSLYEIGDQDAPIYEPSKRRLTWPNGAIATCYSAEEPNLLRGPQHDLAWCLTGDSLIAMADGTEKTIATIEVGDRVMSRSGPAAVTFQALTQRNALLIRLRTVGGRVITGTREHPVWIAGRGFIPLGDVAAGMCTCVISACSGDAPSVASSLKAPDTMPGSAAADAPSTFMDAIASVERLDRRADVYDITVDGGEYFANGLLVHNCDELAAWQYFEAWDNLMMGLRLGKKPRCIATTTPKPLRVIRDLLRDPTTAVTRGSTYDNTHNLAKSFKERVLRKYEGTTLGRQELWADMLEDTPGSLWKHKLIDDHRLSSAPELVRIVVGVDPATTAKDGSCETGIIVAGVSESGHYFVLDDVSGVLSPNEWATRVVGRYRDRKADRVVAEVNNGGDLVEQNIRNKDPNVSYSAVHASKGKFTRAEPIAALYERGLVHHVGGFADLEDQMCTYVPGVSERSPDRMDALVWALTELSENSAIAAEALDNYGNSVWNP